MSEYIIAHCMDSVSGVRYDERREEIVRCRDCEHGLFGGNMCDRLDPGFDEYWFEVKPDGFCAW